MARFVRAARRRLSPSASEAVSVYKQKSSVPCANSARHVAVLLGRAVFSCVVSFWSVARASTPSVLRYDFPYLVVTFAILFRLFEYVKFWLEMSQNKMWAFCNVKYSFFESVFRENILVKFGHDLYFYGLSIFK